MTKYILLFSAIFLLDLSSYAGGSCFLISHRLIKSAEKFHENEEEKINFSEAFKISEDYLTTTKILYDMLHHESDVYSRYAGHEFLFFIKGDSTLKSDGIDNYNKASSIVVELLISQLEKPRDRKEFLKDLLLLRQSEDSNVGKKLDDLGYPVFQEAVEEFQNLIKSR